MDKEQEEQGFRVTDKRAFREDGEARDSPETEPEAAAEAADGSSDEPAQARDSRDADAGSPPKIDFPSYVLGYYTQGLVLLGEVPNPYTNKKEQDVDGARHTIDILSMLSEKTKGNLSHEESQLLESVLYELRMKFMARTNRIKL